jgi:hypothetical protein
MSVDTMQLFKRPATPPRHGNNKRVRLYYHNSEKHGSKWCLRVIVYNDEMEVCARMWFEEHRDPNVQPPHEVVAPAIYLCENIARRALELGW